MEASQCNAHDASIAKVIDAQDPLSLRYGSSGHHLGCAIDERPPGCGLLFFFLCANQALHLTTRASDTTTTTTHYKTRDNDKTVVNAVLLTMGVVVVEKKGGWGVSSEVAVRY